MRKYGRRIPQDPPRPLHVSGLYELTPIHEVLSFEATNYFRGIRLLMLESAFGLSI